MINTVYANSVHQPNSYFNRREKRSDIDLLGDQVADRAGIMWSGDIAYLFRGSTLVRTAMVSVSPTEKNKAWPERRGKIRELIHSGRYTINPEKLAEKMLGTMAGVWMASQ